MSIWAQQLYQLRDLPENQFIRNDEDFAFFSFCLYHLKESRAQCFQDCWVLYEAELKHSQGKYLPETFLEFGATDGKTISNTYMLETLYDWRGGLAEPNPIYYDALEENRIDFVWKKAVTARSGEKIPFYCNPAPDLSSTIFDSNEINSENVIQVETISLNDLIEERFGIVRTKEFDRKTDVGYISMDTEGTEVEILESFNFEKYRVFLWSIEHNFDQDKIRRIVEIMEPQGYELRFPSFSRWDMWFRKKT